MSDSSVPIKFLELFKLTSLGIPQNAISFGNVTLESDKFICVRHDDPQKQGEKMVSIVDIDTQKVSSHKISADSALMHPKSRVLALRAGSMLQIINLEMKSKMKEHDFKSESVVFWKWISVKTVAIVTEKNVYHWSMEGSSTPQLVFKRHDNLAGGLIMNYRTDSAEQWLLLNGLVKNGNDTVGAMQLYSVEKDVTQYIEGHTGCFTDFKISGKKATLVAISSSTPQGGKMFIMEVPSKNATGLFQRVNVPIQYAQDDFPVSMQANEKLGILYILTRKGLLYLVDVESGATIFVNRLSQEALFISTPQESTNGLIGINNKIGQVLAIAVDETRIIPYLNSNQQIELAIKIASRGDIQDSSISDLLLSQFNQLLNQQRFDDAIKLAASSPILRNHQTLQRLQRVPTQPNQKPIISMYFTYIIDNNKLNKLEGIELAKIVLAKQGGSAYIKQLLDTSKIEASEELGDMVRQVDPETAMQIYLAGKCHDKIIDTLLVNGDYKRVLAYCERVSYEPNHVDIFKKLSQIQPDAAVEYAILMYGKGVMDANFVADIFVQQNKIRHATAFFLDILKNDKKEEAALQTRLLEINLMYSPIQVTDQILAQDMFTHFDKNYIAGLCEKANLFHRALENYSDIEAKKRVLNNAQYMEAEWLVNYLCTDL
jgi:clathrin heavy chain